MYYRSRFIHQSWMTVIAFCCLTGGLTGMLVNGNSLIFNGVLEELKFKSGDLSIFYTIRQITSSGFLVATIPLCLKKNGNRFIALLCVSMCAGFLFMSTATELWQFYVAAVLIGCGSATIINSCAIILGNWFISNRGLAVGLASACSGAFPALLSPVISAVILSRGWRFTAVAMAIFGGLLAIPMALFVIRPNPEEVGFKPYLTEKEAGKASLVEDIPLTGSVKRTIVIMLTSMVILSYCMFGFGSQIALFGKSLSYNLTVCGYMSSALMIGNLGGKILIGWLSDKIGIFKVELLFQSLVFAALFCFLFLSASLPVLYLSSGLFGLAYAACATAALPFLAAFGPTEYKKLVTRAASIGGLVNAAFAMLLGYMYDFTGSFKLTLTILLCFSGIILIMIPVVYQKVRRFHEAVRAGKTAE